MGKCVPIHFVVPVSLYIAILTQTDSKSKFWSSEQFLLVFIKNLECIPLVWLRIKLFGKFFDTLTAGVLLSSKVTILLEKVVWHVLQRRAAKKELMLLTWQGWILYRWSWSFFFKFLYSFGRRILKELAVNEINVVRKFWAATILYFPEISFVNTSNFWKLFSSGMLRKFLRMLEVFSSNFFLHYMFTTGATNKQRLSLWAFLVISSHNWHWVSSKVVQIEQRFWVTKQNLSRLVFCENSKSSNYCSLFL